MGNLGNVGNLFPRKACILMLLKLCSIINQCQGSLVVAVESPTRTTFTMTDDVQNYLQHREKEIDEKTTWKEIMVNRKRKMTITRTICNLETIGWENSNFYNYRMFRKKKGGKEFNRFIFACKSPSKSYSLSRLLSFNRLRFMHKAVTSVISSYAHFTLKISVNRCMRDTCVGRFSHRYNNTWFHGSSNFLRETYCAVMNILKDTNFFSFLI